VERIDLIGEQVVPLFYARNAAGEPEAWVKKSKASMKTILPRYNGIRMCMDYLQELYAPAIRHGDALGRGDGTSASELAAWKRRVAGAWNGVHLQLAGEPPAAIHAGDPLLLEVAVQLNGLDASDVVVECLIGEDKDVDGFVPLSSITLEPKDREAEGGRIFATDLRGCSNLPLEGLRQFRVRIYPFHPLLAHRFECGLMVWL
jgi:starch phosphorylase